MRDMILLLDNKVFGEAEECFCDLGTGSNDDYDIEISSQQSISSGLGQHSGKV